MIDPQTAKKILNFIQKRNLTQTFEIIPFDDVEEINSQLWNELLNNYNTVDDLIIDIKNQYHQYNTHIYQIIKSIPSTLRKIGHLLEIIPNSPSFFCGREREIQKINIIRHKKFKNNVLIIGSPGIGKTSLVEAYANKYHIKNIFVVECAKLISNTEYRGSFEQRIVDLMNFAQGMELILFFDEIHALIDLGKSMGGISITDILKPYLLNPKICFLGATTIKESILLLSDEAFKRRFTTIFLNEPSDEILLEIKHGFEQNILKEQLIDDKNAKKIIGILREDLKEQYFPDKFVDFIDYMYAYKSVNGYVDTYKNILEEYIHDQKLESFNQKC